MAVTPGKIAVALGQAAPAPGSPTYLQWELWIEDAEMLIEDRRVLLGADPLDQSKIDYVVREAVVAVVKRPDDSTQVTVTVDDATTSKTFRSSKGRIDILDEWWRLLGLTDPDGAFTIDLVPARRVPADPWFPTTTDDWRGW